MRNNREKQTEEILLKEYNRYYRLAYSYVHNEQDALDIVQESAYRAMKDCDKVNNENYLSTWIYRIVINCSLEFLRKHKKKELSEEFYDNIIELGSYEGEEENLCSRWELNDILENLNEKDKSVIVLRYFEDFKLDEIAHITGENINTVKARLYRALKKMNKEIVSHKT